MASRGQTVTVNYVAWDTNANVGKTGDVANHTLRVVKDGVSSAPTNAPTEVDAANAPGVYKLVLTAAECTADCVTVCGKSSTANVSIMPISVTFEQLPTVAPGAVSGVPILDAGLRVKADLERWLNVAPMALIAGAVNAFVVGGIVDTVNDPVTITALERDTLVNLIWNELTAEVRTAGSYGQLFKDNLNAAIASRAAITDYTAGRAVKLDNLDALISSRAAIADYTAVRAGKLDFLDALISSRAVPGAAMDLVADAVRAATLAASAVDEIWDEAFAELPQAQPAASPTARAAIMLLFMLARNAGQSTSAERRVRDDAGTVIAKAPMSDDGTTFDQGKLVSGP